MAEVTQVAPAWAILAALLLGSLAVCGACLDGVLAARMTGSPIRDRWR